MTQELSHNATLLLKALRDRSEGEPYDGEGDAMWFEVYLDNAFAEFSRKSGTKHNKHAIAGLLSGLEKNGYYEPIDNYAWGKVLATQEMIDAYNAD